MVLFIMINATWLSSEMIDPITQPRSTGVRACFCVPIGTTLKPRLLCTTISVYTANETNEMIEESEELCKASATSLFSAFTPAVYVVGFF